MAYQKNLWPSVGLAATFLLLLPTVTVAEPVDEESVTIDILARQFRPDQVELRRGQTIVLIFENHDSELHAFVPGDLFAGVSLNIGGNGAPEFGPLGFKRVIIPPEGRAEIRFTPERLGEFTYLCDMPGHEMRGTIVVR